MASGFRCKWADVVSGFVSRLGDGADSFAAVGGLGVHVKNVGPNAFSLVATLFWLHRLQPGRNMLVSGARAVHVAPEQHVWAHRHNQTGII